MYVISPQICHLEILFGFILSPLSKPHRCESGRALDSTHLSYCNNLWAVCPQGHSVCHYAANLLCTAIPFSTAPFPTK